MKMYNKQTGRIGEDAAAEFLTKKGFEVVLRNYRTRYGEIDMICRDNNVLVFVEVKTKKGTLLGTPEEMFTQRKYNQVKRMAQVYLEGKEVPCRIDMVAVELNDIDNVISVRSYQNMAF